MVWLSSSHHLIPFTVSFPKMCNSWHSFSHLLFIVPPYQRELRHFGPKYLVVGSCRTSKIFFFLFYYKIWAFPPKKKLHQLTSILPSEIGPNSGAHGVLGWSLCAPSLVLAAPSSLVLAFFWRWISSVQELLRRWFLREEAWTTEG